MILDNTRPMSRLQLAEINATAALLNETTDQIRKLCTRRHPDLQAATLLINAVITKLTKTLEVLESKP